MRIKITPDITPDGTGHREWYQNGVFYSHQKPLVDNYMSQHGIKSIGLNRQGGPAIVYQEGGNIWCRNGLFHRTDGPAIEYEQSGGYSWWLLGKKHRIGGPTVEHSDGGTEWWVEGKRHRVDGPAVEYGDGGTKAWYIDGEHYNEN